MQELLLFFSLINHLVQELNVVSNFASTLVQHNLVSVVVSPIDHPRNTLRFIIFECLPSNLQFDSCLKLLILLWYDWQLNFPFEKWHSQRKLDLLHFANNFIVILVWFIYLSLCFLLKYVLEPGLVILAPVLPLRFHNTATYLFDYRFERSPCRFELRRINFWV